MLRWLALALAATRTRAEDTLRLGYIGVLDDTPEAIESFALFKLALQDVNANPDLLPDHTLELTALGPLDEASDGSPDQTKALESAVALADDGVVAIVGPQLAAASEAAARYASLREVPLVSPSSDPGVKLTFAAVCTLLDGRPQLSPADVRLRDQSPSRSKDECPYFFRARPSLSPELRVLAATAAYYNWTEVAVAVLSPQLSEDTVSALTLQAQLAKVGVEAHISYYDPAIADGSPEGVGFIVQKLEPISSSNLRVIYMMGTAQHGAAIVEAATTLSMTKEHVWIGTSRAGELMDSTATAMGGWLFSQPVEPETHANVSLRLDSSWRASKVARNCSNTTSAYDATTIVDACGDGTYGAAAALAYDSVWLIATALHDIASNGGNVQSSRALKAKLRRASFEGATGPFALETETQDRASTYRVLNRMSGKSGFKNRDDPAGALQLVLTTTEAFEAGGTCANASAPCLESSGAAVKWARRVEASPPSTRITTAVSCGLGQFLRNRDCWSCPEGTYQFRPENSASEAESCIPCDETSFSAATGAARCATCGEFAYVRRDVGTGSADGRDCVCEPGYYARVFPLDPSSGRGCERCPENAHCPGGLALPYPHAQFWMAPDPIIGGERAVPKLEIYRCTFAYLCEGAHAPAHCLDAALEANRTCVGADGGAMDLHDAGGWCADGFASDAALCEDEKPGYFCIDNYAIRCPALNPVVFVALCWIVLWVFFVAINDFIRPTYPMLDLVLTTYQDIGIIAGCRFYWPEQLATVFLVFNVALFDVDIYEPTCLFSSWSTPHVFGLMLLLPWGNALYHVGSYGTGWLKRRLEAGRDAGSHEAWDECVASVLSFFVGSQASLLTYCLRMASCRTFQGVGSRLTAQPEYDCDNPGLPVLRIIATLYIALFIVAPSLGVGVHLVRQRRRNMLCEQRTLDRYGFLYTSFHSDALWWSGWQLTKQALLVIVQVNLWMYPALQGILLVIVLLFSAVLGMLVKPHLEPAANWLEVGGDCLKVCVVGLGLIFTLEAVEDDARDDTGMFVRLFYILQGLYLVVAVKYTLQDSQKVIRRKHARAVLKRAAQQRRPSKLNFFNAAGGEALEVVDTLNPARLDKYVSSPAFRRAPARERASLVELNAALEDHVSDASPSSNFSNSHAANFYRRLQNFLPCLCDVALEATEHEHQMLSTVFAMLEDQERRRLRFGVPPISLRNVEVIDRSSVLFFSLHARTREVELLRDWTKRLALVDRVRLDSWRLFERDDAAATIQRYVRRRQRRATVAIKWHAYVKKIKGHAKLSPLKKKPSLKKRSKRPRGARRWRRRGEHGLDDSFSDWSGAACVLLPRRPPRKHSYVDFRSTHVEETHQLRFAPRKDGAAPEATCGALCGTEGLLDGRGGMDPVFGGPTVDFQVAKVIEDIERYDRDNGLDDEGGSEAEGVAQ